MNGIELAVRFSYITNHLHYCGPYDAHDHFLAYLKSKTHEELVQDKIKKFEGLFPYLSTIAEKHGRPLFDYEVIEAYWLGNHLLDAFTDEDLAGIIKKLMQRGLPSSIGNELITSMPKGLMPHHNYHVLYVGPGRTTGTVPTTIQTMDNCRVSYGEVINVEGERLLVSTDTLYEENSQFFLRKDTKTAVFLKDMLPTIKKGDVVALHWGFAPLILTPEQLRNLQSYTKKIIDILNSSSLPDIT